MKQVCVYSLSEQSTIYEEKPFFAVKESIMYREENTSIQLAENPRLFVSNKKHYHTILRLIPVDAAKHPQSAHNIIGTQYHFGSCTCLM